MDNDNGSPVSYLVIALVAILFGCFILFAPLFLSIFVLIIFIILYFLIIGVAIAIDYGISLLIGKMISYIISLFNDSWNEKLENILGVITGLGYAYFFILIIIIATNLNPPAEVYKSIASYTFWCSATTITHTIEIIYKCLLPWSLIGLCQGLKPRT